METSTTAAPTPTMADEFLPLYDTSDVLAVVVDAAPQATWEALMEADLLEVNKRAPIAGMLVGLRMLPELVSHVVHREAPPKPPSRLRLRDTAAATASDGTWVMLGERTGQEIALGLVGKFWRPVIEYAPMTAAGFRDFAEPGFAKTVYALAVRPLENGRSLLRAEMRTATTDERARRWFRRYWTFGVGSGAHVLVQSLLDLVQETAEGERGP